MLKKKYPLPFTTLLSLLFLLAYSNVLQADIEQPASTKKIIMGFWSDKREHGPYPIPLSQNEVGVSLDNEDLKAKLNFVDILAYSAFEVDKNGTVHFNDSFIDLSDKDKSFCQNNPAICTDSKGEFTPKLGNFLAFSQLQNNQGTLNKIISIGAANNAASFINAIKYPDNFINSIVTLVNYYHLNGVDLDFELDDLYSKAQAQQYADLVQRLRNALGKSAIITIEMDSDMGTQTSLGRKNLQFMAQNVNYFPIMCYDFHSPAYRPSYTGYNSNLFADPNAPLLPGYYQSSCDESIKHLAFLDVPANKILLGIPFYGHVYGGVPSQNEGLYQPFDPHAVPAFDKFGTQAVAYKTVLKLLHSGFQESTRYSGEEANAATAYNAKTKQFIAYENIHSISSKANYAISHGLGGISIWTVAMDVSPSNQKSLLKKLHQKLSRQ